MRKFLREALVFAADAVDDPHFGERLESLDRGGLDVAAVTTELRAQLSRIAHLGRRVDRYAVRVTAPSVVDVGLRAKIAAKLDEEGHPQIAARLRALASEPSKVAVVFHGDGLEARAFNVHPLPLIESFGSDAANA